VKVLVSVECHSRRERQTSVHFIAGQEWLHSQAAVVWET